MLLRIFWYGYFKKRWKCEALFTLIRTFLYYAKLVIYTFMGHELSSIVILHTCMSLDLFVLHVVACCVKSDI